MGARQIACPHCYQMNHYNATRCQHCLGDTWRADDDTPVELPSTATAVFWINALAFLITVVFGAVPALIWLGFWLVLALSDGKGVGGLLVYGSISVGIAALFF